MLVSSAAMSLLYRPPLLLVEDWCAQIIDRVMSSESAGFIGVRDDTVPGHGGSSATTRYRGEVLLLLGGRYGRPFGGRTP
jgi:hypothetical protein